jgi:uncharacterized membrane protein YjgN (DUF898 family)
MVGSETAATQEAIGPGPITTEFAGARKRLFWLALKTGVATILTLGFYRFWARTRLRRWYWSAIRPGGHPLEYTGDGVEKITGFLVAVVILAFWLAIVNLLVMFGSLSILAAPEVAYAISLALLVPLWFWARYRARVYTLSRTRWRGIRFGMAPGALGYSIRACLHWALTIGTLGLLWPWMTFRLEKYRTDRTYFGTARFEQGGRTLMLYRAFAPAYLLALSCVAVATAGSTVDPRVFWLLLLVVPLFMAAGLRYRVRATGLMASEKRLGDLRLTARPSAARIGRIIAYGGLAILILLLLPLLALALAQLLLLPEALSLEPMDLLSLGPMGWLAIGLFVLIYFGVFLFWGVLRHSMITAPILRHYAETIEIGNSAILESVGQRPLAAARGADGFAEALDVGAAI